MALRLALVNYVWDPRSQTPEDLLDRFSTLTGWAEATRRSGADTIVFQRFTQDHQLTRAGVPYRFFTDGGSPHPSTIFGKAVALHAAIAAAEPDVVHVNGFGHPVLLRALRRLLPGRGALVVQDHGGINPAELSWLRRRWWRLGLSAADGVLVAASGHGIAMHRAGLLPKTVGVYEVMESSTAIRADETVRRSTAPTLRLLSVGRLITIKDPLTVLRGFAAFVERRPDATLTFIYSEASPKIESRLRHEIAARAALATRVQLIARVPHTLMAARYSAADIFVSGSRYEGSGYAALEALACGTIPVLTDIASFRALTDDGRVGALWKAGDAMSLCHALEAVASRPLDAQRAACALRFERAFTWDAIGNRALEIYERVRSARLRSLRSTAK